jgi:RNA polymerase sigma-70 factor (ECF subfamily)
VKSSADEPRSRSHPATARHDAATLVSAVAAFRLRRDEEAFRDLYRLVTPTLWGLALRLLGERARAEELVQETWLRVVRGIDGFGERSAFSTWAAGILVRCCWETWRREGRAPFEPEGDAPDRAETLGIVDLVDLERALGRLAEGYRTVVLLHDLYGHTHEEIAALLAIDAGTSKSQLSRGRRALRTLLSTGDDRRAPPAPSDLRERTPAALDEKRR